MSNQFSEYKNGVHLSAGIDLGTQTSDPIASTSQGLWSDGTALLFSIGGVAQKVGAAAAPQSLSGAGAVSVTTPVTLFTSTGSAQALTLAAGTYTGQVKRIMHVVDGGSGVLTPTSPLNFATVTFTNVYDWVELLWDGAHWRPLGYSGATIA